MLAIMGTALVIVGLLAALAVAIGVPMLFGLMAWDRIEARKNAPAEKAVRDASSRISLERGFARAFVIAGGVFWSIAAFAGLYTFRESGMVSAMLGAFFPLVAVLATLAIGWYYERVVAILLAAASIAVVAWGVIYGFEMGVWLIMSFAVIGPMLIAATLFWMARREQDALDLVLASQPELAPVTTKPAGF
jgi:hypothetical protein